MKQTLGNMGMSAVVRLFVCACVMSLGVGYAAQQTGNTGKTNSVQDTAPSARPAVPDRLLNEQDHMNEELGINEFTAPSIRKIFEDLEGLPEIPEFAVLRSRADRPPMDRCTLALQLGGMMADGFIIVQCGKLNEVKAIALDLSNYAKALGTGERVNRHAAGLLKNAEEGDLVNFKNNLALIQTDVEQELAVLRDSDMANLIGLGGWIRALDAATAALEHKFTVERAVVLFRPDVPEYFAYILEGVSPDMKRRKDVTAIAELLKTLQNQMTLGKKQKPTLEKVKALRKTTGELMQAAFNS